MKLNDITKYTTTVLREASENGFVTNIEKDTIANTNFRKVVYTSGESQLVLMSVEDEIGIETHDDIDQFIRVEAGSGYAVLGGEKHPVQDGTALVIPAGTEHNVVNTGTDPLKLYAVYSPPEHKKDIVRKTKKDAEQSSPHFDGRTDLEESYMPNLEVQMPVLTLKKGVAALLKELTGTTVKELQITSQIYLLYTGKLPSKNEIANLIQSRYGVSYEKALAMIKIK